MAFDDALFDISASFYTDVKIHYCAGATRDASGNLARAELVQWGRELSCWMQVRRAGSFPRQRYALSKGSSAFFGGMMKHLALELALLTVQLRRVATILHAIAPEMIMDDD